MKVLPRKLSLISKAAVVLACAFGAATPAMADGLVKLTPLGSQAGEFCRFDRAILFEDPNGTRILYDAGRTVAGPQDPRLGKIDYVLVTHMHGDHVGDRHIPAPNAGSCDKPDISQVVVDTTSSVLIAKEKGATIVTGSEMPSFFANKLKQAGGDPSKSKLVRFGANFNANGVTITTVPAAHSNGIAPAMLSGELKGHMEHAGVTAYAGPPTGYLLTFTNGLKVYLSGDTGITAEQEVVVGNFYQPQLAVINIGDTFTTGPAEAVHVIDKLVKPRSVIPSHANEVATQGGKLVPNTRTAQFMSMVKTQAHLPLSDKTMAFDGEGVCKQGC